MIIINMRMILLLLLLIIIIIVFGGFSKIVLLGLHPLMGGHVIYTRCPLEDSRLSGPSPWKVLATTYEHMGS